MKSTWLTGLTAVVVAWFGAGAMAADVTRGPVMRAALAGLAAEQAKSPALASGKPRGEWSRVLTVSPGTEVLMTQRGARAASHRLLAADGDGVIVLDVSGPSLPRDVRQALDEIAADRPERLLAARTGELRLPRHIRANPAGIFLDERRVADLGQVIQAVPRAQIVDLRVRRKHVGTHVRRGLLIGAAIGAGAGAAIAASSDGDEALPLAGFGAVMGGVYGLGIGTVVGVVAPRSPDVIYHVE